VHYFLKIRSTSLINGDFQRPKLYSHGRGHRFEPCAAHQNLPKNRAFPRERLLTWSKFGCKRVANQAGGSVLPLAHLTAIAAALQALNLNLFH
jgi:hypothetical protein